MSIFVVGVFLSLVVTAGILPAFLKLSCKGNGYALDYTLNPRVYGLGRKTLNAVLNSSCRTIVDAVCSVNLGAVTRFRLECLGVDVLNPRKHENATGIMHIYIYMYYMY